MPSKVYFTNMRATPELNLLQKLEKLIKSAGIGEIDFKKQFTAINTSRGAGKYCLSASELLKGCGGRH